MQRTTLARFWGALISTLRAQLPLACILAFALLARQTVFAQGTTATLGGTVTDVSGAVVPNAQVQLTNELTRDARTTRSNGSGVFTFSAVPTGDYDIQIMAQGFSTF